MTGYIESAIARLTHPDGYTTDERYRDILMCLEFVNTGITLSPARTHDIMIQWIDILRDDERF